MPSLGQTVAIQELKGILTSMFYKFEAKDHGNEVTCSKSHSESGSTPGDPGLLTPNFMLCALLLLVSESFFWKSVHSSVCFCERSQLGIGKEMRMCEKSKGLWKRDMPVTMLTKHYSFGLSARAVWNRIGLSSLEWSCILLILHFGSLAN